MTEDGRGIAIRAEGTPELVNTPVRTDPETGD